MFCTHGRVAFASSRYAFNAMRMLSVPPEVAATLPDDLLKLMGYQIGAYALGYIDDVRDPLEAIRGRTDAMSFGTL